MEILMKSGIRIFENDTKILAVTLSDILEEIWFGNDLNWIITFLDGIPNRDQAKFLMEYQEKINESENGLQIEWKDLTELSKKYFQIYETRILGATELRNLRRYSFDEEEESFENCDIVIILIDCAWWEVYAQDQSLIDKLQSKFAKTELIVEE